MPISRGSADYIVYSHIILQIIVHKSSVSFSGGELNAQYQPMPVHLLLLTNKWT